MTMRPTYKGPPPPVPTVADSWACCEGCTTPRKCVDLHTCVGPAEGNAPRSVVTTHTLKTWPEYFCVVRGRSKSFEIRKADRDYKEGDRLYLREFIPCPQCKGTGQCVDGVEIVTNTTVFWRNCDCKAPHGLYTGRQEIHVITYVLSNFKGLVDGYVALGLRPLL